MRQKVKHLEKKSTAQEKKTKLSEILTFRERPPLERTFSSTPDTNNNLQASDLFSLFTADIIKEKKVFIR